MKLKQLIPIVLASIALLVFIAVGVNSAVHTDNQIHFQKVQINSQSTKIKKLNIEYDKLNSELDKASQEKDVNQDEVNKLHQQMQDLEKQKQDLESQLQAKLEQKNKLALAAQHVAAAATSTNTAYAAPVAASGDVNCDLQYTAKEFIYCHESGNAPWKHNELGCYGLGQDCNGIVEARCGADYACQDEFFTDYMIRRYGSWDAAKAHWQARVPINGKDVGNWW